MGDFGRKLGYFGAILGDFGAVSLLDITNICYCKRGEKYFSRPQERDVVSPLLRMWRLSLLWGTSVQSPPRIVEVIIYNVLTIKRIGRGSLNLWTAYLARPLSQWGRRTGKIGVFWGT